MRVDGNQGAADHSNHRQDGCCRPAYGEGVAQAMGIPQGGVAPIAEHAAGA